MDPLRSTLVTLENHGYRTSLSRNVFASIYVDSFLKVG